MTEIQDSSGKLVYSNIGTHNGYEYKEGATSTSLKSNFFNIPKQYEYKPKKDITTFELAQIIPILTWKDVYSIGQEVDSLPDKCKRHFVEV